jgi:hypothetical protein
LQFGQQARLNELSAKLLLVVVLGDQLANCQRELLGSADEDDAD